MTSGSLALVLEEHAAYNAHDLDRMMACYAADAVIIDGDGRTTVDGIDAVPAAMANVFERMPEVHADWPTVFEVGEWVAMHDIVPDWQRSDGTRGEMQWVALYRVVNGKIHSLQLFS